MTMGLLLVILGIVIWLLVSPLIGLILVILGIVLLFVPGVPYGYSSYRGRRGL
jgi:Flp pilus assembly protein TadB